MGDGPNRLGVSESDDQPPIHELKDTAFGFHGGICRLIEQPPHLAIAVRRSMTVIDARALVVPGAGADHDAKRFALANVAAVGPTSAMICCADHPEAGHGGQPLDGILMDAEQLRDFLIELPEVRLHHFEFVEGHREQVRVNGMHPHTPRAHRN